MKKLITLIAGLLLVALPVGLAGCDDSDKEIYNDGRLVTDVVIPTSMTVYRGMEVSVSGRHRVTRRRGSPGSDHGSIGKTADVCHTRRRGRPDRL